MLRMWSDWISQTLLAVSSKVKYASSIWSSQSTSGTYPREAKCILLCSALLITTPKWKQPKCSSTGEWVNLVHPYSGILFSNEEEQIKEYTHNTGESQKHYAE